MTFSFLGLSALSSSCSTIANDYFDRNVLQEGPIPSSQMSSVRVLSPPVNCFVWESYPLQSNFWCEGPIPSIQMSSVRVLSPPVNCFV